MVDVIGGSTESLSRVVGSFFLGLTLGSALAGLFLRRAKPFLILAWMELGVLVSALPLIFLPAILPVLWTWLGESAWQTHWGGTIKSVLSMVSVLIPALFMGFFLPFAIRIITGIGGKMERSGLWLYGLNTLGGVAGIWLVIFWIIPFVGVTEGLIILLCLNAVMACIFFALHRYYGDLLIKIDWRVESHAPTNIGVAAIAPGQTHTRIWWLLALLSFFSGWALLAAEVGLMEMLLLLAPISYIAPGVILSLILFCLALAAVIGVRFFRVEEERRNQRLWYSLLGTGVFTLLAPVFFHLLAQAMGGFPPQADYGTFLFKITLVTGLACGPALVFAGMLFPWITSTLGQSGESDKEKKWAYLLAINGLGGFLGAEMSYRWLMPWIGLHVFIGWIAVGYIFLAIFVLVYWLRLKIFHSAKFIAGLLVLGVSFYLLGKIHPGLPVINQHLGWEVLEHRTGRDGTVVVVEDAQGDRGIIVSNQYMLASSRARWRQERQGHLPLLLHPEPQSVAFIGIATGMTPSAALSHPSVRRIVGFELSEEVARFSREYFQPFTYGLFSDDRFEHVVEDGRLGMAATTDTFDVIVGDLFLPWGVGAGRLYSLEHFQMVYRSLRKGGLFFQWLPMHQLTEKEVLIIVSTLQEVFPEVYAFVDGFESGAPSLALAAWKNGRENTPLAEWEARFENIRDQELFADPFLRWPQALFMLEVGTFSDDVGSGLKRNTLNAPEVELSAASGRSVLRPDEPYLTGRHWVDFLRKYFSKATDLDNDFQDKARAIGRIFIERNALPDIHLDSTTLQFVSDWFPPYMIEDQGADWNRWSGLWSPGCSRFLPEFNNGTTERNS